MRTTAIAEMYFMHAADKLTKKGVTLEDLGKAMADLCLGLGTTTFAMKHIYDKLEQIDRKLSSASGHRRPTM